MSTTSKKFFCTGSLRGMFENTAARLVYNIIKCAQNSGNAPAALACLLDVVRDEYADLPGFVTLVCESAMARAERLGLLNDTPPVTMGLPVAP